MAALCPRDAILSDQPAACTTKGMSKIKTTVATAKEPINVLFENDVIQYPHCPAHGPALLFAQGQHRFFACSAVRDRNVCPLLAAAAATTDDDLLMNAYRLRTHRHVAIRQQINNGSNKAEAFGYCAQCQCLVGFVDFAAHSAHVGFHCDLTKDQLQTPTRWLRPLDNDSKEAQYFFSDSTLNVLANIFITNNLRKIICIGTPRLYEFLNTNYERLRIDSVLLDLDDRLEAFYDSAHYYRYNMFNNYFLDGRWRQDAFKDFLSIKSDTNMCLVTDPPFGCRTEPLVATIKTLSHWYRQRNGRPLVLPVIWVFPYFMDHYVQKEMPEMEMVAYHVNYTNHSSYHDGQNGRKQGSPIRLFTNIPLELVPLPASEWYVFCRPCRRWVRTAERHCTVCKKCPSRNGVAYVHCDRCAVCVKPNYRHCAVCGRCTQVVGHRCAVYKQTIRCWICQRQGHIEIDCAKWFGQRTAAQLKYRRGALRDGRKRCFLCGRNGHNELACSRRKTLLKERRFLNEVVNKFS